jgi:hypothetical protein
MSCVDHKHVVVVDSVVQMRCHYAIYICCAFVSINYLWDRLGALLSTVAHRRAATRHSLSACASGPSSKPTGTLRQDTQVPS